MSRTQTEAKVVDVRSAHGPDLHAVPTFALERELTERRLAAKDTYQRSVPNPVHGPRTERLFIDEPDRP